MTVFIQKGDAPMSVRQATKRGMAMVAQELAQAGARKGDEELLRVIPHADLPDRLAAVVAALGHATYADYAAAWEASNVVNGAHNLFNHQIVAYRAAIARLRQYRLGVGRPEVTEEQPVLDELGNPVLEEATGEPVTETVVVLPAIEPLDQLVEVPIYDEDTGAQVGTDTVTNPLIVQDEAERAQAQAVIDQIPAEVKTFVDAEDAGA